MKKDAFQRAVSRGVDDREDGAEGLRKPSAWGSSLTVNIEPLMKALDWLKDPDEERGLWPSQRSCAERVGKQSPAGVAWGWAALGE